MPVVLAAQGSIVTLTLDRPEARNALSIEMCRDIVSALGDIDALPEVRVVLVRGTGDVFCSGADFAAISGPSGIDFLPAFEEMLETVARHRLPTVAVIQGAALGGGLQLATVCDFRLVATDARLGIPAARFGILVNLENVRRLAFLAGIARAKEILMAARTYVGEEAVSAGLATSAVEPTALDEAAAEFAGEIASLAPLSLQGAKRSLQLIADSMAGRMPRPEEVEAIEALVAEVYASEDLAEGLSALSEKRPPRFKSR